MREALREDLQAGFAGHPLRQFIRRAAEPLLQLGMEELMTSLLGRGHYERAENPGTGSRNGYGHHTVRVFTPNFGLDPFCFLIQGLKVQPMGFAQNSFDASTG
jgi:hypothetical protein